MNSINEKEKKLNIALEELKNLDLTNPELQKNIENLSTKQNQLEIEKIQIEEKYKTLLEEHENLSKKLEDLKNKEKLEEKKYEESFKIFLKSSTEENEGYRVLSLFGLAETNYKKGNIKEMSLNYKNIYEDTNIDLYYRDLSRILSVMKDNISTFDKQINILKPILNSPSKLQLLAAELEIMLYVRSGNVNDAYTKIKNLLKRPDISLEQKSRLELLNKIYISNAK